MRLRVGGLELQNQKLIKARRSTLNEARDSIVSFLEWVFILPSVGRERSVPLVRCVLRCEIHTDNPNANRTAAFSLEFLSLSDEVTDNAIDLFDHCLGQYFGFGSDFDVRHRSTCNGESLVYDRLGYGDSLAECSVTSSS